MDQDPDWMQKSLSRGQLGMADSDGGELAAWPPPFDAVAPACSASPHSWRGWAKDPLPPNSPRAKDPSGRTPPRLRSRVALVDPKLSTLHSTPDGVVEQPSSSVWLPLWTWPVEGFFSKSATYNWVYRMNLAWIRLLAVLVVAHEPRYIASVRHHWRGKAFPHRCSRSWFAPGSTLPESCAAPSRTPVRRRCLWSWQSVSWIDRPAGRLALAEIWFVLLDMARRGREWGTLIGLQHSGLDCFGYPWVVFSCRQLMLFSRWFSKPFLSIKPVSFSGLSLIKPLSVTILSLYIWHGIMLGDMWCDAVWAASVSSIFAFTRWIKSATSSMYSLRSLSLIGTVQSKRRNQIESLAVSIWAPKLAKHIIGY